MDIDSLDRIDVCDSLYISPQLEDALFACAARLVWERDRGRRILFVTLFAAPGPVAGELGGILDLLRARHVELGLAAARQRSRDYASFGAVAFGRRADDHGAVVKAVYALTGIGERARPREVYVPLGVGGHVDHRVTHDAGLGAFESRDDRNVFLYEERPDALVPGAVRVRLGQIGARLPPAAADTVAGASLARFVRRFHLPHAWRGDVAGVLERLRAAPLAAREWRESRRWRPHKGLGPRIQPVVHVPTPSSFDAIADLRAQACAVGGHREPGEPLRSLAGSYSRLLGGVQAERYWLLLPRRETDGQVSVVFAEEQEAG